MTFLTFIGLTGKLTILPTDIARKPFIKLIKETDKGIDVDAVYKEDEE